VCYPWHRWYGRDVLTSNGKGVYAVVSYACRLPDEPDAILQIPRWMFDSKICATMRIVEWPRVECTTLRDLRTLIAERGTASTASVVQRQASQPIDGDADGENHATRSAQAAGPILGKGRHTSVERSERTNTSRSGKSARAASAGGADRQRRTAQRRSRR
jgi:hypothetical protein